MKTTHRFSIPLLIGISSVMAHAQEAAKVVYVQGDVQIVRANKTLTPQKGDALQVGDQIQTGTGKLQLKFVDGAVMALNPQSKFQIDRYHYNPNQPSESVAHTHLIQGGLRTVTGAVAKVNKPGYQLETATGVIGVRGTEIAVDGSQVLTLAGVVTYSPITDDNLGRKRVSRDPGTTVVLPAGTSFGTPSGSDNTSGPQASANTPSSGITQNKPVIDIPVAAPVIVSSITPASVDIPAAKETQKSTDISSSKKPDVAVEPTKVTTLLNGTTLLASQWPNSTSSQDDAFVSGTATFERLPSESTTQARLVSIRNAQSNTFASAGHTAPYWAYFNLASTDSTLIGQTSDQLLNWGSWKAGTTTSDLPTNVQPSGTIYWLHGQNPVAPPASGTLNYTSVSNGYAGEISVNGISSPINSLTSSLNLDLSNSKVAMNTTMGSANGYTASFDNTASPLALSSISNGVMRFDNLTGKLTGNATPKNTSLYLNGSIQLFGSGSQPNNAGMSFALRDQGTNTTTVDGRGVVAYKK